LTTFRSTLSQLLTWRVGDVLPVDLPELVDLEVEGLPLASGRFGISNDRNALRIETVKEPEAVWEGQVAEA
jgi:flagellar motor switch protein FliM